MVACFKCSHKNPKTEIFFCQKCGIILPALIEDPYLIFSLKREYVINPNDVTKAYNQLQTKLHPDNFLGTDKVVELLATQQIMRIKHAYKVLLSPRLRSEFLLKQQGIIVNHDGNDTVKPAIELLTEIFAIKEQITEAEDQQEFRVYLQDKLAEIEQSLEQNFRLSDYKAAAQDTIRYSYFEKTLEDLL